MVDRTKFLLGIIVIIIDIPKNGLVGRGQKGIIRDLEIIKETVKLFVDFSEKYTLIINKKRDFFPLKFDPQHAQNYSLIFCKILF